MSKENAGAAVPEISKKEKEEIHPGSYFVLMRDVWRINVYQNKDKP
jgi:hypothetical protein